MKLATTLELFAYWNRARDGKLAPDRADIDPGAIRRALGDTFILAYERVNGHRFRLAGTRVCALFGHELKGEAFLTLWGQASGRLIEQLTGTIGTDVVGAVASVTGITADGDTMPLELLLLPLEHRGRLPARLLGSLTPVETPYWLGVRPLERLTLGALRFVGPATESRATSLAPVSAGAGRERHGFVVYEGGRGE
jgi:hypothetical protein